MIIMFYFQIFVGDSHVYTNMPEWHSEMMREISFRKGVKGEKGADFYAHHFENGALQASLDNLMNVKRYVNSCEGLTNKLIFVESFKGVERISNC